MAAVQGQKENNVATADDSTTNAAVMTNEHTQGVVHKSKALPETESSGDYVAIDSSNGASRCSSKQASPISSIPAQATTILMPSVLQQPVLQDNNNTSSSLMTKKLTIANSNGSAIPQVVKKGRFTVVQEAPPQVSNQQSIDRTTSTGTTTQVQKGRFTVTLDASVSVEGDSASVNLIPTSTPNLNSNGKAKTTVTQKNFLHPPSNSLPHGVSKPATTSTVPKATPPIVKKKGRFVVTSAAPSPSVLPISQGSTVGSTDTIINPPLHIQNEGVSMPSPNVSIQNETVSIPKMVTAVPQIPIEPLGESPRVQGSVGTPHIHVPISQGIPTCKQNTSEKSVINPKVTEDHQGSKMGSSKSLSISSRPPTNGKPPSSFDSKGFGSTVGLGKMFHYLEQMKGEVSEADRVLKSYQKEVKFLKERNKELELKCRETEKRWMEEKMNREASENKLRNLKKKMKDLRESMQNQSLPQLLNNGDADKVVSEESTKIMKSTSMNQMPELIKQSHQPSHVRVSSVSSLENGILGDVMNFNKRSEESPSRMQSRQGADEIQIKTIDNSSALEKATIAAVNSLPAGARDPSRLRHSSEDNKPVTSRSESNHRRHMSSNSLQPKSFARVNSSVSTDDSIPIMSTNANTIMSNNPGSLISSNTNSIPLGNSQSMATSQNGHASIMAMQTQQQQAMTVVQQNLMNGHALMTGQQQSQKMQSMMGVNANQHQQQQWNSQGQFHSNSIIQPNPMTHAQQIIGQSMMNIMPNNSNNPGMQQQALLQPGMPQQQGFLTGQQTSMQAALQPQNNLPQAGQLQVMGAGSNSKLSTSQQQQQQFSSQQQQQQQQQSPFTMS